MPSLGRQFTWRPVSRSSEAERLFERPAFEPSPERSVGYAEVFSPRGERLSFPVKGQQLIVSLVAALRLRMSPHGIAGSVALRVIHAFEREACRARPKAANEALEGPELSRDGNPAPAIPWIGGIVGIFTAAAHVHPALILARFTLPMAAMSYAASQARGAIAATGHNQASEQFVRLHRLWLCATSAATQPLRMAGRVRRTAQNRKIAEGPARQVYQLHTSNIQESLALCPVW